MQMKVQTVKASQLAQRKTWIKVDKSTLNGNKPSAEFTSFISLHPYKSLPRMKSS